jgi:ribosomal protein L7/L12
MQHSGLDVADLADQEVVALLAEGKKVEAINLYQEYTGVSLEEAKKHVEGKLSDGQK